MDFFLSKPIRRPALKHVLKTYCPTIPEEESESTIPPTSSAAKKSNGHASKPAAPSNKVNTSTTAPFSMVATSDAKRDDSPAISPSTTPMS
jgi:osomolarity two-component system sensor histidine kinase SLN1